MISNNEDLTLPVQNGIFNYRVSYYIFNEESILLTKNNSDSYYFAPGGRIKFQETFTNALIREVKEELKIELQEDQYTFAGIIENYFTLDGKKAHELSMCFYVKLENIEKLPKSDDNGNIFNWIKLADIKEIDVYPKIIKEKVHYFQDGFHHFVNIDK